jgi:hypothetical protein
MNEPSRSQDTTERNMRAAEARVVKTMTFADQAPSEVMEDMISVVVEFLPLDMTGIRGMTTLLDGILA